MLFRDGLSGFPMAHAIREAGTLGDPIAIFPHLNHYLAHRRTSIGIPRQCISRTAKRAGYRPCGLPEKRKAGADAANACKLRNTVSFSLQADGAKTYLPYTLNY